MKGRWSSRGRLFSLTSHSIPGLTSSFSGEEYRILHAQEKGGVLTSTGTAVSHKLNPAIRGGSLPFLMRCSYVNYTLLPLTMCIHRTDARITAGHVILHLQNPQVVEKPKVSYSTPKGDHSCFSDEFPLYRIG